ncbi:copper resistance D family protein [Microbulbifer yueqingensis]|uniref:Copper resistance protein D n=1 Tax=Microbulbifer yueqingensis TaxID=658219 RepID=A0A1G8Y487_9GAMM|nr:CopD family protein [Microbulbifer yueqingensis]SDJ96945.1 putative copper resistance protein D [Microbulbifer yueqingensis]
MWATAFALNKWLLYGAMSVAIGGTATILLWTPRHDIRPQVKAYLLPAAVAGLLFAATGFLLQVGTFAEAGLGGMFDRLYLSILWQSPAGEVALLQGLGFLTAFLAGLCLLQHRRRWAAALWLLGAFLLLLPFGWRGHTADSSLWLRAALSLHAGLAAWWMGALYPLWRLSRRDDPARYGAAMVQFGRLASWPVALLVLCGIWVLYSLLNGFAPLFQSNYGLAMLVKLALVATLLLLAAQNKWRLVPRLPATAPALAGSIRAEMLVGVAILFTTALLSTLTGPGH